MGASRRWLGGWLGGVVLSATLVITLVQGAAASTAPGHLGQGDRDALRQAMVALTEAGAAGVQVRLHDEDGDWTGTAGVRELGGGAVPADGEFRVGSITKTFVTTVVLQLVDEGRVALDDPLAEYLPSYGLDPRITVRMMLQHTSGVFDYTGESKPDGSLDPGIPLYGKDFEEHRFDRYTPDELIGFALSKPARFEPGTDWSYSNTNFVLAGQLIERVTGHSYAEEIRRRVLAPLGLRHTYLPGTRTGIPGPHAHGYYGYPLDGRLRVVDATRISPTWASSAGEIISTTADLDRFVNALLGGRLLPANLLAEMRKASPFADYGLGMELLDAGPQCGGTYYGHTGSVHGYLSVMYSSADRGTRIEVSETTGAVDSTDPAVTTKLIAAINDLLIAALCDGGTPADKSLVGTVS